MNKKKLFLFLFRLESIIKKISMKITILLSILSIALLFNSCQQNNPQPNSQNNNNLNQNWKIKVTVNGVTHEASGPNYDLNSNFCYAIAPGGNWVITAKIADTGAASYISGNTGTFSLQISSPHLGLNDLENCKVASSWFYPSNMSTSGGYSLSLNGPMVPNTETSALPSLISLPINLTDLGSPGANNLISFGNNTIKGNYSGTIYFRATSNGSFNIPITLNIEFESLRS